MLSVRLANTTFIRPAAAVLFGLYAAAPALAHAGHGGSHGFASGLAHPLTGLDHMLAMLAIGVWAAQLGGRAIWAIPGTFIVVMLAGAGMGFAGVGLPFVESGIAASVLVLGLMIASAFRAPLAAGMCLTGACALFHGHAHGNEMASAAPALATMLGFAISTALLHLAGIGLGRVFTLGRSAIPRRIAGGLLAVSGCVLFTQLSLA